jgi:DNA-binding transcriptional ArsR family regulator
MATSRKFVSKDEVVDKQTGEVATVKKEVTLQAGPDDFFMVFLTHLSSLFKITNSTDVHVLVKLCELCQFNSNTVSLSTNQRREITEQLKITQQTFTNSLRSLRKAGLVTGERGLFTLNPEIVWKGSVNSRNRLLRSSEGIQLNVKFKQQIDE